MPRSPEFVPKIKKELSKEPEPKITAKILEDKHDRRVVELENRKRKIVNEFRKTGNENLLNDLDNTLRRLSDAELEQTKELLRRRLISEEDYGRQKKDLEQKVNKTVDRQNRRSQFKIIPLEEYSEILKSVPEEIAEDERKFIEKD